MAQAGRPPRQDPLQLQSGSSRLLASHRGVLSPVLPGWIPRALYARRKRRISSLSLEISLGHWGTLDGRRLLALNWNLREEMCGTGDIGSPSSSRSTHIRRLLKRGVGTLLCTCTGETERERGAGGSVRKAPWKGSGKGQGDRGLGGRDWW